VWLGCVLLIALGLRLGWGLTRPTDDAAIESLPDQREYLALADNVLHGRGLEFLDRRLADTVYAYRMPAYPLFVAGCGANIRVVRAVQAAVDTSTVLAVFLLASALCVPTGRGWVPLLAACIAAFNPYLVYFSGLVLSETLFTALLAWGLLLLVMGRPRVQSGGRVVLWLSGGLLLALSVLVRPSAVALPVVLGIGAAFVNRTRPGTYQEPVNRRPLPVGTTMLLLTMLVLIPWWARNFHVLKRAVWLDTNGGITLYDGYNPDATGASNQGFIRREPELKVLNEVDRSEYLSQKAIEYARSHPRRDIELAGAKLARTWSPVPLSDEFGRPAYRAIALAYSLPLDVLVVLGLMAGRLPKAAKVLLLLPAIYFSTVHALTVGSLRYRMPAEPPMAVIAADFLGAWAAAGETWRRAGRDLPHPT
jgi:hypothetical protein